MNTLCVVVYIASKDDKVDAIIVLVGNFSYVMKKLKIKLDEYILEKISKNLPGCLFVVCNSFYKATVRTKLNLLEGK